MINTLVTGFTPFDGRNVNASWIAAKSLGHLDYVRTLEIPVVWGQPAQHLAPLCEADCPGVIISLGEGREGWFDIETVASNTRNERPDNNGELPEGKPVIDGGEDRVNASIDAMALRRRLALHRFPIRVSSDAGAYLCEETLYTLEHLKQRHTSLAKVVFVHLPPFDSAFSMGGKTVICNEAILQEFAATLIDAVHAL